MLCVFVTCHIISSISSSVFFRNSCSLAMVWFSWKSLIKLQVKCLDVLETKVPTIWSYYEPFRLAQTFLSCYCKFDRSVILANIPRCCKWSYPLRFSNQQFMLVSDLSHSYSLSHPVHNLPKSPNASSLLVQNVLYRALFSCAPHLYGLHDCDGANFTPLWNR
jgi:hypothetical protein